MTNIDDTITEVQPGELAIARRQLEEKEKEIQALKIRVDVLEGLLARLSAQRVPQTQPHPSLKPAPRRWSVR